MQWESSHYPHYQIVLRRCRWMPMRLNVEICWAWWWRPRTLATQHQHQHPHQHYLRGRIFSRGLPEPTEICTRRSWYSYAILREKIGTSIRFGRTLWGMPSESHSTPDRPFSLLHTPRGILPRQIGHESLHAWDVGISPGKSWWNMKCMAPFPWNSIKSGGKYGRGWMLLSSLHRFHACMHMLESSATQIVSGHYDPGRARY